MTNLPSLFDEFNRPFGSWRPLLRQIDDMFNNVLGDQPQSLSERLGERPLRSLTPAVDIEEDDDHFLLSFDMPGVDKSNINLEIDGNMLVVSGERSSERKDPKGPVFERRWGRFERSVTLPDGVKADAIEAQYRDGVLSVYIPRSAEAKRTKIKIEEGKGGFFKRLMGDGKKALGKGEAAKAETASSSGTTGTGSERFEPTH